MDQYLDVKNKYDENDLREIADKIRNGALVLFPTETVYGIGTNGLNSKAVEKIYDVKGRTKKNPVNLLVSSIQMINQIAKNISPLEYKLMESFFPGPFTIILEKKEIVPDIVTAGTMNVGVRMPAGEIAFKLVSLADVPIAAPSANLSGTLSGTTFDDIFQDFFGKVDYMINGGESKIGIESTIVKVIDNIPHILRPGAITAEEIRKVSGNVIVENNNTSSSNLPSSSLKHYQLKTKSIVVFSENYKKMNQKIIDLSKQYINPTIICPKEHLKCYPENQVFSYGSIKELDKIAKYIFHLLRNLDEKSFDIILIEGVKQDGLGLALMNRFTNISND